MKYLINKETKEHVLCRGGFNADEWTLVEADSEGWIAHTGKVCPLPEDALCDLKLADGFVNTGVRAQTCWWHNVGHHSIVAYRPILAEKVQEPDYDPRSVSFNLLDRLKAAHEAAQQIPFLEAELRLELAGMGYTLGMMSPFVESANSTAVVAEPKAAVETTQDKVIAGALFDFLGFLTTRDKPTSFGATRNASPAVKLLQEWANKRGLDLEDADVENFHSRPAKGE